MTFFTALAIISICLTITLGGLAYGLCYLFRYIRDIDKAKNHEERAREFMDNINDIYESFNASA